MIKKWIIGILAASVFGAVGAGINYQINEKQTEAAQLQEQVLADQTAVAAQNLPQPQQQQQIAAKENMGEPWFGEGLITGFDANGMHLQLQNQEMVYVELGPEEFWTSQLVQLQENMQVQVMGSDNEGMIHAYEVALMTGEILQLRTADGQPLWSGGASNENGQNGDGTHTQVSMAAPEEWLAIEGTLIAYQGGNMTLSTADEQLVSFQTGQPRFFSAQGVNFVVGDQVLIFGFWQDGQFVAGDITQVSTGLKVMLRDPNGRPLWAGAGSNGNGNGGSGAAATATP